MPWKEYYDKLSFNIFSFYTLTKIKYTETEKRYFRKLFYSYFIFFIIVVIECYITNKNYILYTILNLIILLFIIFVFSYSIHRLKFFLIYLISEVYINKKSYDVSFNQKKIYDYHKKEKKDNPLLFYITIHYDKCLNEENKKLFAFINSAKEGIEYLKRYKRSRYHFLLISNIFIMSFILFWGLLFVLDNLNIKHNNVLFLVSGIFVISFLTILYRSISQKHLDDFYKQVKDNIKIKYKCKKISFYTTSPKDEPSKKEETNREFDIIGLIFGVLFTLYITLLYNKLYVTAVEVKTQTNYNTIEINKNHYKLKEGKKCF